MTTIQRKPICLDSHQVSYVIILVALFLVMGFTRVAAQTDGASNPHPQLKGIGDRFSFTLIGDPQVGHKDNMGVVSADAQRTLREAVGEINAMRPVPRFAIFMGDEVNVPDSESIDNFLDCLKGFKPLSVLVHGNHDTRPPYTDFRLMEKRLNGIEAAYYSFDAGRWHFIILPCNLDRSNPEEEKTEQEMLKWLGEDLKKNAARPTMVFNHLHQLPAGLTQLEYYTFPLDLRLKLMDSITKYGNVKYFFNGHVHNGIEASVKTAWHYKGINFITVPTIIHSRQFGEEYAGFERGMREGGYYLVVDVNGEKIKISGRLAGEKKAYAYPDKFPEFRNETEPRWFKKTVDLKPRAALVNGEFERGLKGWTACYRYLTDKNPGFVWGARADQACSGKKSAYIFTREKGQDWAGDEFQEIYQMVAAPWGRPMLEAHYRPENVPANGGGYIRLLGFGGGELKFMMMFKWGHNECRADFIPRVFGYNLYGKSKSWTFLQDLGRDGRGMYWNLPEETGRWHSLKADIASLYDTTHGGKGAYAKLGVTQLFIAIGTWTNCDKGASSGAWFDAISLKPAPTAGNAELSSIDDRPLTTGPEVFKVLFGQDLAESERARLDALARSSRK